MCQNSNDIVLTGLSARLPESDSIEEFADQLFKGVDLVTDDGRRWNPGLYGLPHRSGKLKNIQHFDASFFGVHPKQAHVMDPQLRLLLELSFETLVDAGINPIELRGSNTGVFVGVCNSETETLCSTDAEKINGYGITGCCRAMFSNRISYTFDFKGPSLSIDTACSSSMVALVQATKALRSGECDTAIVAGANLCLSPKYSLNFRRLNMLSSSGRCAAFDASGDGYVRSEAVVMVLLQRRSAARRVYATIKGACRNNDGYKVQGITYPSGDMQQKLVQDTFKEARLNTKDVTYVEAHGTGTKAGDPEEVNAIAKVFCQDRDEPLLMGSVKSNMGHSEPASGLCSLAKVLISMERGMIPGNLHFKIPNQAIPSLNDGRIKVVDKNTKFEGGLVSINTFGFGGTNTHVILESEPNIKDHKCSKYTLPRLVIASGRTEEAVNSILNHAAENNNPELHALIDVVYSKNITGHPFRGSILLKEDVVMDIFNDVPIEPPQIWFIFTGMGSQWPGMASDLMQLPPFASSIERCAKILSPLGIDLTYLITKAPGSAFNDVISSFVSIVAVQIALVNVLRLIGIKPDGMLGHSVGEVGCAYADDTFTEEQAVLSAYWRGRSIVDSKPPPGAMAAVGLTWEECLEQCPEDIFPACHNSTDSVTISGLETSVENFVNKLSSEGVFARLVNSSGVAFHSKYIAPAAPLLRESLDRIIKNPKTRSQRWISTSLPEDQWSSDLGKYSDAAYHVNNLLSPVHFASALQSIPQGAIIVEVSPHGLLQPILKRALPSCAHIPLMRKGTDNLQQFLTAVGKMYGYGAQPDISALYPPITWPVTRGTPGLSSHVRWDHSTEWLVAKETEHPTTEYIFEIDLKNKEYAFLADYKIDGRILFPASGYLMLVWKTLAKIHKRELEDTPVQFENVRIKRNTILTSDTKTRFLVNILNGVGEFDIFDGNNLVVTGSVKTIVNPHNEIFETSGEATQEQTNIALNSEDIYKELRLRGYNLHGEFKGIVSSNGKASGELAWKNNWTTFIDTMFQFYYTGINTQRLYLPVWIQCLTIDPKLQKQVIETRRDVVPAIVCNYFNTITAGGVQIKNFNPGLVTRRNNLQALPKLEKCVFTPYIGNDRNNTVDEALTICLQLIIENVGTCKLKCTEVLVDNHSVNILGPKIVQILEKEPLVRIDYYIARGSSKMNCDLQEQVGITVNSKNIPEKDCHFIVSSNAINNGNLLKLSSHLKSNSMLLLQEQCEVSISEKKIDDAGLILVSQQRTDEINFVILRKRPVVPTTYKVIEITEDFSWFENVKQAVINANDGNTRIYVVSYLPSNGILGLTTCIRSEGCKALRAYFLPNAKEKFSTESFASQIKLDLVFNVLKSKEWGSYRNIQLEPNNTVTVKDAYVNSLTHGDMASLCWIESPLKYVPDEKLCNVYYASLSFRDVMMASGKMPREALPGKLASQECVLGLEYSGELKTGKRVMGMVKSSGLATTVIPDKDFMWEVPGSWSLEEAATVPLAYTTAYYALVVRGRMRHGESVLIHSGAGGVGLAAIAIALHSGCKVFTTVGTSKKRHYLKKIFPVLSEENIGCSRDVSFEKMIMRRTKGRGVDIVLNSLAAEKLQASVRCLAFGGRFLELAKLDLFLNNPLGLSTFLKNTTFHGILLEALFDSVVDKKEVMKCLSEGIANGAVQPLPATVFSHQQLEQAFRFMVTGKHIGKIIIKVQEQSDSSKTFLMPSVPRIYFNPSKVYVLVGGLGGFGLELTEWLISRGATKLILNSRNGIRTGYQSWRVGKWRNQGVKVLVSTTDATTVKGAKDLINEACSIGELGGVFNLAAVIRDALMENLSEEDFRLAALPKIEVTKSLDQATREMVQDLDYFVAFSSVTSGRGNPGQCNYGYANSSMERLMELRREDGLHGLAIQWGAIGDVGLTIENLGEDAIVNGTVPQKISSCLVAFEKILRSPYAITASMALADKHKIVAPPTENLVQAVANILGVKDPAKAPQTTTLANLGLDSLMVAEIKQTLERNYDIMIGVQEIRNLTFLGIKELAFK